MPTVYRQQQVQRSRTIRFLWWCNPTRDRRRNEIVYAAAYNTAMRHYPDVRTIVIRNIHHNTMSYYGQTDPNGWHVTIRVKEAQDISGNTYKDMHGYTRDQMSSEVHWDQHWGPHHDSTGWPRDSDCNVIEDYTFTINETIWVATYEPDEEDEFYRGGHSSSFKDPTLANEDR
ncbi:hypothetical protein BU16DRAFT_539933 [Lophium mytilinum]|uniref:Uncharacterized protein n=1 Tax=Lophium mytilinum TaxID=390894 RepID=A0A6A6QUR4_9PEZI|nr:hypothetical protein BU16DRAFT_539933 [Lophium mytilinum]